VISSGSVKAFVKNAAGKNTRVREMKAGEFFGEISLLSGKPRTATVTASSPCDLLELDRATLDDIAKRYPHVRKVVQEFYDRRSGSESEVQARSS
jgi:CRP-like cAMP-binding protein